MSIESYFSTSYARARDRFHAAALDSGARLHRYQNPDAIGWEGEALTTDVACYGPDDASLVYMTISGTHGAEGFCGSGAQVGQFEDRLLAELPPSCKAIVIHALNPYGFSWVRRVTEGNVDLNRNFLDFAQPLPVNTDYEVLHEWLLPADWDGPAKAAADAWIADYIHLHGGFAFQSALSRGQYSRANGLFYGGARPVWSNRTFRRILHEHIPATAGKIVCIDYHSGAGLTGYGEPICVSQRSAERSRSLARDWFGAEVTNLDDGSAVVPSITGALASAFAQTVAAPDAVMIALEFGTLPMRQVAEALRADHWLYAHGDPRSQLGEQIREGVREAFFSDSPAWRAAVHGRAVDFAWRSFHALARV